ncbi:MAG: hypothetical protein ACJ741_01985 [Pyrinomonadaceae bacterium]
MVTPRWHFNERRRGDKNREPIVGEFFATDVIRNPAEALTREGIQNTLDAVCGGATARVRFYLSGADAALPAAIMTRYMRDGWPHFLAERNGLKDCPGENAPCPFLVLEDFGTTGLTGDTEQWEDRPGVKNSFYYFCRAEGQSGKGEQDRGRWGVGKTVFPRSSRLNTFYAFTVRDDDKRHLLLGQTVLRSHHVSDKYYTPDGYFGLHQNDLSLPVEDAKMLEQFRQDFRLSRENEPGLSIVVPWCDEEITFERLLDAVMRQYYYPILSGKLSVTVATPEREVVLDDTTLLDELRARPADLAGELIPLIELTQWSNQQTPESMTTLSLLTGQAALKWSAERLTDEQIAQMRVALEKGEHVAVRVPVTVREKKKPPQQSFFDVFLVRDGSNDGGRSSFLL